MNKTEKFIAKAKKVHGDTYEYDKVEYIRATEKVIVTCKTHGDFEQAPYNHTNGSGCPKCALELRSKKYSFTKEQFIEEAKKKHGEKYDYSKVNYKTNKTKVTIICPVHGDFEQSPAIHKKGSGCMKCHKDNIRVTKKEFIKRVIKNHTIKYDYSKVKFKSIKDKVIIGCPTHGDFQQTVESHLKGQNCLKCAMINRPAPTKVKTTERFIEDAKKVHGDLYDYSKVNYIGVRKKIKIICKKHGEFKQDPNNHLSGYGCGKCGKIIGSSKKEDALYKFINKIVDSEQSNRSVLVNQELDIYVKLKNIAFEFNGLYWHSDKFKDKNYHLNKTNSCKDKNTRLIHIFEDSWVFKKDIVKSRVINLLGKSHRVYARKTEIREVPTKEAMEFLDVNHLQGRLGSKIKIGLYEGEELVSIMTFGSLRKNLGSVSKEDYWELGRFCNKLNTTVVGGASKILKHFIKNYRPKNIISYADIMWSNGNLYEKLGFEKSHTTEPNYYYVDKNTAIREDRFKYRKSELVKQGFDPNKTEKQIMQERGYNRIYDCGSIKYVLSL